MTLFLLILAALIVILQIALTLTLRRVLDLLAQASDRVDALQQRVQSLEHERDAAAAAPSGGLFTLPVRSEPPGTERAPIDALRRAEPEAVELGAVAEFTDLPVLQEQADATGAGDVGARVRELSGQGVPVREIAERCGLSEAEAELFIRLRQEPR